MIENQLGNLNQQQNDILNNNYNAQQTQLNAIQPLFDPKMTSSNQFYDTSKKYIENKLSNNKQPQSNGLFIVKILSLISLLLLLMGYSIVLSLKYYEGLSFIYKNITYPIFDLWKSTLDFVLMFSIIILMCFLLTDSAKPKFKYEFQEIRVKIWWNLGFWSIWGSILGYFIFKKISNDISQLILDDWVYYLVFIITSIIQFIFWFIFISNNSLVVYESNSGLRKAQKRVQKTELKNAKRQEKAIINAKKKQVYVNNHKNNNPNVNYTLDNLQNSQNNSPNHTPKRKLSRFERKKQKLEQKISKLEKPKEYKDVDDLF